MARNFSDADLDAILADTILVRKLLRKGIPYKGKLIQSLSIEKLKVDPRYQRNLNENKARQIAAEFDPDALGVFHVSRRNNKNKDDFITDGQTRRFGMQLLPPEDLIKFNGDDENLCLVKEGSNIESESKSFLGHNNSKPVTGNDKFKAVLAYKGKPEYTINQIMKENGLFLTFNNRGNRSKKQHDVTPNGISGAAKLLAAFKDGGEEVFRDAVKILKTVFSEGKAVAFDAATGEFIWGLCKLLKTQAAAKRVAYIISKLKDCDPAEVVRRGKTAGHSTSRPVIYAQYFADICCFTTLPPRKVA
jgi:hypothetical protein